MTIHTTATGAITLLDTWGHGVSPRSRNWWANAPAVIRGDDGDGHFSAWKVDGSMADAAAKLGELLLFRRPGIAVWDGARDVTRISDNDEAARDFFTDILDDEGEVLESIAIRTPLADGSRLVAE
jgi:hypothetical protein